MNFRLLLPLLLFPSILYAFDQDQTIRVGLQKVSKHITIEGEAIQILPDEQSLSHVAINRTSKIAIEYLGKNGKFIWKVMGLRSNGLEMLYVTDTLTIKGRKLRQGLHPLPQKIILSGNRDAQLIPQIEVIGEMNLHDYLVGVLASEVPLSWPLETLKAQAIAARSYSLVIKKERAQKPYHLQASIADQVFRPVIEGNENDPLIQKASLAVRQTDGVILKDQKNRILKAFYHADCGGQTASAREVWQTGFEFGTANDEACPAHRENSWGRSFSKDELQRLLKIQGKVIQAVSTKLYHRDQRVREIEFVMSDKSSLRLSGVSFRGLIGSSIIKSTKFKVREAQGSILFSGKGYGHGVGLCQWGSQSYGKLGWKSALILKHYYPKAQIGRLGLEAKESAHYE